MGRPPQKNVSGSSQAHSELIENILLCSNKYGVFWKNPIGVGKCIFTGNTIKFGLKGSPDIIGFNNIGLFVGIECKTGASELRKDQKAFREVMLKHNCVHIEARNLEECLRELKNSNRIRA